MPTFVHVVAFLPGAWIGYGVARWVLSFFSLSIGDQIAMAALAGVVCLVGQVIVAWEFAQNERKKSGG